MTYQIMLQRTVTAEVLISNPLVKDLVSAMEIAQLSVSDEDVIDTGYWKVVRAEEKNHCKDSPAAVDPVAKKNNSNQTEA